MRPEPSAQRVAGNRTRTGGKRGGGGRYFVISQLGNAFCSSAMPASVTSALAIKSVCRLVNPYRCTRPASVILVPFDVV